MARFDVTTFGESMLRLSVPVGRPLELSSRLDMNIAGSESNTLAVLAQLGHDCSWASSLPDNVLGQVGDMVVVTQSALDNLLEKGQRWVRR